MFNKYYERDIENAFVINHFFFHIGIWPFARANSLLPELMETILLVLACLAFLFCELILTMLYVFMVLTDFCLRLKVIGSAVVTIVEIIKYGYVLLYKSQVKNCLMLVDEDWRNDVNPSDRILMIDRVKTGKRPIVMCVVFVYVTCVAVKMIMPLLAGKIVTPQNITIRPLPVVAYFVVFEVQRSPFYKIVYLLQCVTGVIKYTIIIATFGFVTLCEMHFCTRRTYF